MTNSSAKLSAINIYPIKSTAGISLPASMVENTGLAFDRRFIITDMSGMFITGRTHPKITLIKSTLTMQGVTLNAPNMTALTVNHQDFSSHYENVQVWNDTISAQYCSALIDVWFSEYIGVPCKLAYFGKNSSRQVKHYEHNNKIKLSFADGYPLLLISQGSLNDLNQRLFITTNKQLQISMAQFRPNLVVNNSLAFAEDGWRKIRIGEVEFDIAKPCSRCMFTTVDPQSAEKHNNQEPLTTLKKYRLDNIKKEIMFGQNLVALNQGKIRIGDKVEVLSTQQPTIYVDNIPKNIKNIRTATQQEKSKQNPKKQLSTKLKPPKQARKKINIFFDSWDKHIEGNNHQSLLEQGENAGLILAYSCRAGMCGRCKVKLESGEVEQLASDGLTAEEKQQGYILACSCVPKTDVVINKN